MIAAARQLFEIGEYLYTLEAFYIRIVHVHHRHPVHILLCYLSVMIEIKASFYIIPEIPIFNASEYIGPVRLVRRIYHEYGYRHQPRAYHRYNFSVLFYYCHILSRFHQMVLLHMFISIIP